MKKVIAVLSIAGLLTGCGNRQEGDASSADQSATGANGSSTGVEIQSSTGSSSRENEMTIQTGGNQSPDNTKTNIRDREGDTLTPLDQGSGDADRKITQAIRRSIVIEPGDDEHSFAAKNIKIITIDGMVTLRGVVKSDAEKTDLEARAKAVEGVRHVDNQLEVKP